MTTFTQTIRFKRNTSFVATTGLLNPLTGVIGAGQLLNTQTGAALDNTVAVVKGVATDTNGNVLSALAPATYVSSASSGARWDYVFPATLFDGSTTRILCYLKVYALDGTTEQGEYLFDCQDSGQ